MDSQGLWNGTTADNTVTPSCFSCHKAHGTGTPSADLHQRRGRHRSTEDGNGGVYKDLCRSATPRAPTLVEPGRGPSDPVAVG